MSGLHHQKVPAVTSFTAPPRRAYGLGTPWQGSEYWRELIKKGDIPHDYKSQAKVGQVGTPMSTYGESSQQPWTARKRVLAAAGSPNYYLEFQQEIAEGRRSSAEDTRSNRSRRSDRF